MLEIAPAASKQADQSISVSLTDAPGRRIWVVNFVELLGIN